MKKKLSLNNIKVESFVTLLENKEKETINGQAGYQQLGDTGPVSNGNTYCPSEVHRCTGANCQKLTNICPI